MYVIATPANCTALDCVKINDGAAEAVARGVAVVVATQLASAVEPAGHAAGQLQGLHDVAPVKEKVPARQVMQDVAPRVLLHEPAIHEMQEDAPLIEEYLP